MLFSVGSDSDPFIRHIVTGVVWSTLYPFVGIKPTGTGYLLRPLGAAVRFGFVEGRADEPMSRRKIY